MLELNFRQRRIASYYLFLGAARLTPRSKRGDVGDNRTLSYYNLQQLTQTLLRWLGDKLQATAALLVNMNNLEAVFIFICVLFIRYQHVFKLCWESLIWNVTWVKDGKLVYKDDDDGWGSYVGEVDQRSRERNGYGKMTFDNGSYYEGGFVNNKYEGDKCVYRWPNGDEYEGGFEDGVPHGVGILRSKADGFVEYRISIMGVLLNRVRWSADGKKAYLATMSGDGKIALSEMRRSGRPITSVLMNCHKC